MKKISIVLLAIFLCVFGAGCGMKQKVKDFATEWKADGREYGKEKTFSKDDTVETAFFKVKVNSITTEDEIEGYVPEDKAHQFIVANITVENTYEDFESITMFLN